MRARDMGIPKYNSVRKQLGLQPYTNFAQVSDDVRIQEVLQSLYTTVDDIDAIVGAYCEQHVAGGEVGITFAQSITQQFERLRDGDRLWYENTEYWTIDEIEEVHGTKLETIILRNFPNLSQVVLPLSSFYVNSRQLANIGVDTLFPDPLPPPDGFTWMTVSLAPAYLLHWVINFDTEVITIQLQVKTNGWVGIGFSPDQINTMKGADIVACNTECYDLIALDVGLPTADQTLGGLNNLQGVTINRNNGFCTVQFSRKLDTQDKYDKVITDNQRIIFAFHPFLLDLVYHGPTRSSAQVINWLSGAVKPPQNQTGLYIGISIGIFVAVLLFLGILYYYLTRPLDLSSLPEKVQVPYRHYQNNSKFWEKHDGAAVFYSKDVEKKGELSRNLSEILQFLQFNTNLDIEEAICIYNPLLISSFINFRNIMKYR
eukprot:TRINITY_DN10100_c0_g4_i1.p1 TRINITY_DN10100_c0_g4~~TRINITY_DN10100_c0_g4_i1.p1  ORF type:complete len:429 (-),score=86.55 TRINITY_DN10100_c0_g4_i1:294-1580(-)